MAACNDLVLSFYTFLLISSLSFIGGQNVEVNRYRLPNDTVPVHYDLKFDIQHSIFYGETRIYLRIRKLTSSIVLHSKNLVIDELTTNIKKDNDTIRPKEHVYDNDTDMMYLRFESPLERTNYTLTLKFMGSLSNDLCGLFKSHYSDAYDDKDSGEELFIATHLQRTSARRVFPCWDEPALKATFNISIKHSSKYTALSNMPAYKIEHTEDEKTWTHFETTPIMSTNILAIVLSTFHHISNSDDTIRIWARKGVINDTAYFMRVVERATEKLEQYLNSTVRVPKMDHVALTSYSNAATENWGLVVYAEFIMSNNNDSVSMESRMRYAMTAVHEMVHQWFGNLVSPAWWKYYWLSEGMATYLKYYIADKLFKDWSVMDDIIRNQINAFSMDDHIAVSRVNKEFTTIRNTSIDEYFVAYTKPSLLFWMLSHMIGEDAFRAGLLNYIDEHKYSSVTSDDLWKSMQKALNQSGDPNFSIKEVMDTWIEQTGYPLVTVTRNYTTGDVMISQAPSPFANDKIKRDWWISINYATRSNPDFSMTKPMLWLRPTDKEIVIQAIDVDDWIIVNLQHVGYYRVNYDSTNWKKIAEYLNTDNYRKIHAGNRIQLLNTAFHLTAANQLNPTIFLELVDYLQRETDPVVWKSAFILLERIKSNCLQSPRAAEILKPYILRLMLSFIETIDYEKILVQDDFSTLVKLEALDWACQFGHKECKEKAAVRLSAYISDSPMDKIPIDAEYWIFCMGLATANQSTWNTFLQLQTQNHQLRKMLKYLSCAEDPMIVANYLYIALTKNSMLSEHINPVDVFLELNDMLENTDVETDFVIRNFDKIANVTNQTERILDSLIWKINTLEQIDKLKTFLRTNGINKESPLHYREKALKKIEEEVARISNWFESYSNRNVTVASKLK